MKLDVLGCATPFPSRDNPCSGYLLSEGGSSILLDCGSGVFSELIERVDPNKLAGVWISHMHPDHFGDMPALANWALNTEDARKLPVYGPEGWNTRLDYFLSGDRESDLSRSIFDVRYIADGQVVDVGSFQLTSRVVHHSVTSYGVRVSSDKKNFAYSGDSGPCEALSELALRADLFVCEAGAKKVNEFHLTAKQAYETALSASVRKLLLTHIPDPLPNEAFSQFTSLDVQIASPGKSMQI